MASYIMWCLILMSSTWTFARRSDRLHFLSYPNPWVWTMCESIIQSNTSWLSSANPIHGDWSTNWIKNDPDEWFVHCKSCFSESRREYNPTLPTHTLCGTNLTALVTDLLSEQIVCLQLETSLDGLAVAHLKRLYLWVSDLLSPQVKFHHQRHTICLHVLGCHV